MAHAWSTRLVEKIRNLGPTISELLGISGSPGLSIGVLHHGEVIYTDHRGRRDIAKIGLPNDETMYYIASLTKPLTVAAMALLVEEGQIQWDTRIYEILPEFKLRKDTIGREATVIDVLSNRTGLSLANAFWGQRNGEFLLPKSEMTRMSCEIQAVKPFRKAFLYTNWNYALATAVIEKVAGKTFGTFVKEKILDPLNMQRTTIGEPSNDNIAFAHAVYNDGTACRIPFPNLSDDTGMAGGAAGKSTIKDLLLMYKSLLSAYNHQRLSGLTSTPGLPFKHLRTIFSPHIELNKSQSDHQAYCLGLYKTELPGNIGVASINNAYLGSKNTPFPGQSKPGLEVFHHTGLLPGGIGSMFLIPSSETAIVVLTNSLPLSDPTDFSGRLILSVILDENPPTNFVGLSKLVRQNQLDSYTKLAAQLEKRKTTLQPRHLLSAYEGEYLNNLGNYCLRIKAQEEGLLMIVQGMKSTRYSLSPYDGDTFYWPANREQELCVDYGFPYISQGWHKIVFAADSNGFIDSLTWDFDMVAKPEVFRKMLGRDKDDQAKL